MPRYVEIKWAEMNTVLSEAKFRQVSLPGVWEMVYQRDRAQDFVVRVYTTIAQGGVGRDVGKDAIRVQLVHTPTNKPVWTATRTHRTPGWQDRMLGRMKEAWTALRTVERCPDCRTRPMVIRKTKDGSREFLGCVGFPSCKGTVSLRKLSERRAS